MDLWIRATHDNALRVWNALKRFGAPTSRLSIADLTLPDIVFQIGLPPRRIDLLTSITGLTFDKAWPNRLHIDVDGLRVPVLGRSDLITNKRATARTKDLADVEVLETRSRDSREMS
jgi:hypothetical protein